MSDEQAARAALQGARIVAVTETCGPRSDRLELCLEDGRIVAISASRLRLVLHAKGATDG